MLALPDHVTETIEQMSSRVPQSQLQTFAKKLQDFYAQKIKDLPQIKTKEEHIAYLNFRLPATFAAICEVFERILELLPDVRPTSLLDLGAGPGTSYLAADAIFGTVKRATLVERDPYFIELGKKFVSENCIWQEQDLEKTLDLGSLFDLTVLSYSLGELKPEVADSALDFAFKNTSGLLAVIEPGTPKGYENIIYARDRLLQKGAHIIAPCPHAKTCPIPQGDWCHFSKRLQRTRLHRQVKGASLGYEDEKFSYVVFSKKEVQLKPYDRIIRAPQRSQNEVQLTLCTHDGNFEQKRVTKKDKESFTLQKKASWGDVLLDDVKA